MIPWHQIQQSLRVNQCDVDQCLVTPCLNDGQCQMDASADVHCLCETGYTGQSCQTGTVFPIPAIKKTPSIVRPIKFNVDLLISFFVLATGPIDLPQLSVDGYLAFRDSLSSSPQVTVSITLRPISDTGLLLYNALRNDFFGQYHTEVSLS